MAKMTYGVCDAKDSRPHDIDGSQLFHKLPMYVCVCNSGTTRARLAQAQTYLKWLVSRARLYVGRQTREVFLTRNVKTEDVFQFVKTILMDSLGNPAASELVLVADDNIGQIFTAANGKSYCKHVRACPVIFVHT